MAISLIENWAGQLIEVGDYVYRGARDGNTSSFKFGKVVAINLDKQTVRVEWLYWPASDYITKFDGTQVYESYVQKKKESNYHGNSTCSVDTVIKVDNETIERLERIAR